MQFSFRNLGNKKPHGEKEVKPWGNKRRLRFFISRPKEYSISEKNAIRFSKKVEEFCELQESILSTCFMLTRYLE